MKIKSIFIFIVFLFILVFPVVAEINNTDLSIKQQEIVKELKNKNSTKINWSRSLEMPRFISASKIELNKEDISNKEKCLSYLDQYKDLYKINNPWNEFILKEEKNNASQNQHLKWQQIYKGIEVYGSELIVHFDKEVV